jgi:hypothetical protein
MTKTKNPERDASGFHQPDLGERCFAFGLCFSLTGESEEVLKKNELRAYASCFRFTAETQFSQLTQRIIRQPSKINYKLPLEYHAVSH